jgi:ankyrin repeat protein
MGPVHAHSKEMVRLLVNKGANVNCVAPWTKDYRWATDKRVLLTEAISVAAAQPYRSVGRKLRRGSYGRIPEAIPLMLIRAGANVNRFILDRPFVGAENRSMLGLAAHYGMLRTVRAMIAAGADVNLRDNAGRTALFDALSGGHATVAKALLDAGARVDLADQDGMTPVAIAARRGLRISGFID